MKREDFVKGTKEVFETFNDPVNIVSCQNSGPEAGRSLGLLKIAPS